MKTALVAVEIVYSADQAYSYRIPDFLEPEVSAGSIVRVPFGKSNRNVPALVLEVRPEEREGLKEIASVSGEKLEQAELRLVQYIQNRYFCSYFDALKLVFPSAAGKKTAPLYERFLQLTENAEHVKISEKQQKVVAYLQQRGSCLLYTSRCV